MSVAGFDKLNIVATQPSTARRSMPYEQYFVEMELSDEEKEKRIILARKIELELLFIFSSIRTTGKADTERQIESIKQRFEKRYLDTVGISVDLDDYLADYIAVTTAEIIETTVQNMDSGEPDEAYYLSDDRAMFIAEDSSNSILNHQEFEDAKKNGKTHKKWRSMKDRRVRKTHAKVDDTEIEIGKPFQVGKYKMMFPKDNSLGAGAEEIIGCRCSAEYL